MERAEASKVALYGVADYAWNMKAYNPESDFAEACRYVLVINMFCTFLLDYYMHCNELTIIVKD